MRIPYPPMGAINAFQQGQFDTQLGQNYAQQEKALAGMQAAPPPAIRQPAFRTSDLITGLLPLLLAGPNKGEFLQGYLGGKMQAADTANKNAMQKYQAETENRQAMGRGTLGVLEQKARDIRSAKEIFQERASTAENRSFQAKLQSMAADARANLADDKSVKGFMDSYISAIGKVHDVKTGRINPLMLIGVKAAASELARRGYPQFITEVSNLETNYKPLIDSQSVADEKARVQKSQEAQGKIDERAANIERTKAITNLAKTRADVLNKMLPANLRLSDQKVKNLANEIIYNYGRLRLAQQRPGGQRPGGQPKDETRLWFDSERNGIQNALSASIKMLDRAEKLQGVRSKSAIDAARDVSRYRAMLDAYTQRPGTEKTQPPEEMAKDTFGMPIPKKTGGDQIQPAKKSNPTHRGKTANTVKFEGGSFTFTPPKK